MKPPSRLRFFKYQVNPGNSTIQIEYIWTKKSRSTAFLSTLFGRKWKRKLNGLGIGWVSKW